MTRSLHLSAWLSTAAREHWLSMLVLIAPIFWVVWNSDADNILPLLLLPFVALAVGFVFRPRHVWLIWLAAVLIQWIAMFVLGDYSDPGPDETRMSITVEAFIWMAIGVLGPVWTGRVARWITEDKPLAL